MTVRVLFFLILVSCRTDDPDTKTTPPTTPTPTPTAARSSGPAEFEGIPLEWRSCQTAADCVVLPSSCCRYYPSNITNQAKARHTIAAYDSAHSDECKNHSCPHTPTHPFCEHSVCVVWQ